MPKVSVVMSVYNAAAYLPEAVQSVLAQTFSDFEFLIIDDGSTDESPAILAGFTDSRIQIITQENRGLIASLNRGIQTARGQYIARMDADDLCRPDRFQLQVDYLDQHPEIALLGGSVTTMDECKKPLAPRVMFPATHAQIWRSIGRRHWVFCHPAVMYRREAAIEVGLYNRDFAHAEDTEFFARLMTRYHAANLPDVLLNYRLSRGAVSFAKKDHGQINRELVAKIIDHWQPGEPFVPTPEERRAADQAIEASSRRISPAKAEAFYQRRIGREFLRGRNWQSARRHYLAAARSDPWNYIAYAGAVSAPLHIGGAPKPVCSAVNQLAINRSGNASATQSKPALKIIVAHNFYQQSGGEDQVFADETALLESHGHKVIRHTVHNDRVAQTARLTLAGKTIWNRSAYAELHALVQSENADIVHFHNTFPLLSPAVYSAARSAGAAVVQTLHNYRMFCPTATCYRDGHVCEDCLGKTLPWPAIVHRCYRNHRGASAAAAVMLAVNHGRGTYEHDVDRYIALTEFAKSKFIQAGLPQDKITVKPNFVAPDPGTGDGSGGFALFVGRLTENKGIATLLRAWKQIPGTLRLKIAGDGELAGIVSDAIASDPRIQWLGRIPSAEIYRLMGEASVVIFPSLWYEGLPKTIIESFAAGTPVIASRLGSMTGLITDGLTGTHFTAGDPTDLAAAVQRLLADPGRLHEMRTNARHEYESLYTADANYNMLMEIYEAARPGTSTPMACRCSNGDARS